MSNPISQHTQRKRPWERRARALGDFGRCSVSVVENSDRQRNRQRVLRFPARQRRCHDVSFVLMLRSARGSLGEWSQRCSFQLTGSMFLLVWWSRGVYYGDKCWFVCGGFGVVMWKRRRVRSVVWFLRRIGERGGPSVAEEEARFVSRHLKRDYRRNFLIFVRRVYQLILRLTTKEKFICGGMGFTSDMLVQGEFPTSMTIS